MSDDDASIEAQLDQFIGTGGFDMFSVLPEDILLSVMHWLSVRDICALACVCQRFNRLTSNEQLWREKCMGRFDTEPAQYYTKWKQLFLSGMRKETFATFSYTQAQWVRLLVASSKTIVLRKFDGASDVVDAFSIKSGSECCINQESHLQDPLQEPLHCYLVKNVLCMASELQSTVKIFNVDTGTLQSTLLASDSYERVTAVAYDTYSREIVAGFINGKIRIWHHSSVPANRCFFGWQAHHAKISSLRAVKPSDFPFHSTLVSSSHDNTVKIWKRGNNVYECEKIIEVPGDIHYLFVGASVDRIVAASSEVAKLCVLSTGETLATIEPQDTVDDVTMSKRCVAVRGEALTAISLTNLVSNSVEVYDTVTGISDSVFMTVKVYNVFTCELVSSLTHKGVPPPLQLGIAGKDCLVTLSNTCLVLWEAFTTAQGKDRKRAFQGAIIGNPTKKRRLQ